TVTRAIGREAPGPFLVVPIRPTPEAHVLVVRRVPVRVAEPVHRRAAQSVPLVGRVERLTASRVVDPELDPELLHLLAERETLFRPPVRRTTGLRRTVGELQALAAAVSNLARDSWLVAVAVAPAESVPALALDRRANAVRLEIICEQGARTGARRRRLPFHLQRHCVRGRAAHGCHNDHRAARSARRYQTHAVHTCDRGVRAPPGQFGSTDHIAALV